MKFLLIFLVLIMGYFALFKESATCYYQVLENKAKEDVDFLSSYLNYDNRSCLSKNFILGDYFDEVISRIKSNPAILFQKKITFSPLNYLVDQDIGYLINLFKNAKCISEIDFGFTYVSLAGVRKICNNNSNIKTISIEGTFDTDERTIKELQQNCIYYIKLDPANNRKILLTKPE